MSEKKDNDSNSPVLFMGISGKYLQAFEVIWSSEYEGKNQFYWDKGLVFHPISQLLGVALETSIKGLLVCRQNSTPKTHDLEKLKAKLSDSILETEFDQALTSLRVPEAYYQENESKSQAEVAAFYRRHGLHFHLLNRVYDRPFASRYPVLGGHCLPDPEAVREIVKIALKRLSSECRSWRPAR